MIEGNKTSTNNLQVIIHCTEKHKEPMITVALSQTHSPRGWDQPRRAAVSGGISSTVTSKYQDPLRTPWDARTME